MRSGISIRNQISLFSVAALVLFLAGCQGSDTAGTASVRITLNTNTAEKAAARRAAPAPSGIVSVTVDVSGPGMEPLSTASDANHDGVTTLALEVPAGPARRFDVTAFDNTGAARYQGSDTVDLVSGASVTLTIEMVVIQINPLQIDPPAAILTRGATQTFTLGEDAPSQVDFFVNGTAGGDDTAGRIAPDGTYTAPAVIPIDRTNPNDIGVPTAITVDAVDKADPDRRDAAQVKVVTGLQLEFGQNVPVSIPDSVSTHSSGQRSVAYHNGKVYAAWAAGCSEGCSQILFSETSEKDRWPEEPVIVGTSDGGVADPSLAVGPDGSVYIAYVACLFCDSATIWLYVRPSGETDFQFLPLTMVGSFPQDPTVAVSPTGVAFVAWSDVSSISPNTGTDIFLQRVQVDEEPKRVNTDDSPFDQTRPAISIAGSGEVFVAWEVSGFINDNFFLNIAATASTDGGATFLPAARVDDPTEDPFDFTSSPTVAAGPQGNVYIAWELDWCGDGCTLVYFAKGTLDAEELVFGQNHSFGEIRTSPDQESPSIAWDGANGIYVAFRELPRGENLIRLAKSIDNGSPFTFTFSQINSLAGTFVSRLSPSLAVDGAGRAFAIWTDERNQGLRTVFFAMGDDFTNDDE
ncbi:glycoside hydrolase family 43 protein [Candidatus Manganitrophus noduliformans]|uniref:Glycoside hydrolase family 43 protein n=1 Tax=Candidatus Manganitrophus noduliformans TaxID=2606439 RepID=A0A7X6DNY9_9BACT|nr:glycoside hydrolase family 43 protein [Candidatus Manganitrophus noduliformans]NKE70741.1 glycoside hydrolase family 43 protein [Candidatus Manganitrophus noduliformans]